jgi:hypothetical protein
MSNDNADFVSVASDPDLFKVRDWLSDLAKVRVIETVVGPYGAIDLHGGTVYFDIGDTVVRTPFGVIVVKTSEYERIKEVYGG